jgi:hypothetical protein
MRLPEAASKARVRDRSGHSIPRRLNSRDWNRLPYQRVT